MRPLVRLPIGIVSIRTGTAWLVRAFQARPGLSGPCRFLDHSSLAVTTTYLRRLEGQEDRVWAQVAAAIGV